MKKESQQQVSDKIVLEARRLTLFSTKPSVSAKEPMTGLCMH